MQAKVGDRIRFHSPTVGRQDSVGEIIEVRGIDGSPPYLVRFDDGHERLIYPGPEMVVESS
ncbi:hypothetical protein BDV12DRAFT_181387 [Aspergillus spectabilis]